MCQNFAARTANVEIVQKNLRTDTLPEDVTITDARSVLHFYDHDGQLHKGASAALKILAKLPAWKLPATILLLPPFIFLAQLVYRFIALNRFVLFGSNTRIAYIKYVLILACLTPMLISQRLWLGDWQRSIPTTAITSSLSITYPWDLIIYIALLALLVLAFVLPKPRYCFFGFTALAVGYSLSDLNRLMPYYLEFYWCFLLLGLHSWSINNETQHSTSRFLSSISLILFSIWFWSGIHKLNITYLMIGFPWLISPLSSHLAPETAATLNSLAILTPLIESCAALALLFPYTRFLGIIGITTMHVLILLFLGPLGHNYNHSVWSWNIAHIALCWLVFYRSPVFSGKILFPRTVIHALVLCWFLVFPVLNYLEIWPRTLSYSLYTWAGKDAEVYSTSDNALAHLPSDLPIDHGTNRKSVPIQKWFYLELKSPPFDEDKVYLKTFSKICQSSSEPEELFLSLRSTPNYLTGVRIEQRVKCQEVAGL